MSLTKTWRIDSMKVKDEVNADGVTLPRAVYQTYWTVTGTNSDGHSGSWSGATPFTAANVPEGEFTPFADLTEATVLGWIQAVVNADASYAAHIDEQIEKRIEEEHGTGEEIQSDALPWATEDDAVTPEPPADATPPADDAE
jgi:hypothetical protein